MIIFREDFNNFSLHEDYIRKCCPDVTAVYSNSIYFFSAPHTFFSWNSANISSSYYQDFILAAINGICKTGFRFEESKWTPVDYAMELKSLSTQELKKKFEKGL